MIRVLDRLEDKVRHYLSRHPRLYALVSGAALVLFWRGVWELADTMPFMTPIVSIVVSVVIMLLTGTFVAFFIGGRLLISGLRSEKRVDEKTLDEINAEEHDLASLRRKIADMSQNLEEIKSALKRL